MARAIALCLLCLLLGGLSTTTKAEEAAIDVPLCQLLSDPGAYDHKLIRVTGRVSRGFEDFGLHDPSCPEDKTLTTIWLEYGGQSPQMSCIAARRTRRANRTGRTLCGWRGSKRRYDAMRCSGSLSD